MKLYNDKGEVIGFAWFMSLISVGFWADYERDLVLTTGSDSPIGLQTTAVALN